MDRSCVHLPRSPFDTSFRSKDPIHITARLSEQYLFWP
ncbi:hypothetical protein DESC_150033 [Desulfosarcina cetonica]|nr:hypothetical protein DESC_150033 [Desulfosarcina cetonica]